LTIYPVSPILGKEQTNNHSNKQRKKMETSLHLSILELNNESFFVPSGHKTDIYLDTEKRTIYSFVSNGGVPVCAYNGIDTLILSVWDRAIPAAVVDTLLDLEDDLLCVLSCYEGTEYDGRNHVGVWASGATDAKEFLWEKANSLSIGSFWDPSDWFGDVLEDLQNSYASGKTPTEIITEQHLGDWQDGECDRDEAIAWLEDMIQLWDAQDSIED
jgi:hypothetical protein